MGFPSKRILIGSTAEQMLAEYEGSGALVNRGPNTVVLAETEAGAAVGTGITDETVESFALKVDEGLEVNVGKNDSLWARCAATETACLHFIAEN